jgi:hypothetical protein
MGWFDDLIRNRLSGHAIVKDGKGFGFSGYRSEADLPLCGPRLSGEEQNIRDAAGHYKVICGHDGSDWSWQGYAPTSVLDDRYVNTEGGDSMEAPLSVTTTGSWANINLDGVTEGGTLDFYKNNVYQGSIYSFNDDSIRICTAAVDAIVVHPDGETRVVDLAGSGTRMVVADADGDLSTQAIGSGTTGPTGLQGPQGFTGAAGPQGFTGTTGPQGPQGVTGHSGSNAPFSWKQTFDNSTTMADPGNGEFRLNNATQSSSTIIANDILDNQGTDISGTMFTMNDSTNTIKGHLRLEHDTDPTKWLLFNTTTRSSLGGWHETVIANSGGSGTTPFTNGDLVKVSWQRTGDQGATGTQGPQGFQGFTGPTGPTGAQGNQGIRGSLAPVTMSYQWNAGTTDSDPGSGFLKINNASFASSTFVYIDDLDAPGNSATTIIDAMDDSSSLTRGQLRISLTTDPSVYVLFDIVAGITSASTYRKIQVSHVANGGSSFSAADSVYVTFTRTGDKGDTGAQGATGAQGPQGFQGTQGFTGPAIAVPGATTQVIFNDAGTLAGDAGMTYNKTTNTLSLADTLDFNNGGTSIWHINRTAADRCNLAGTFYTADEIWGVDSTATAFTINADSRDMDFVVKGDTAECLRVDASTDRVGIKTAAPACALEVTGEARVSTAGTNTASVVTVGGTQTLTAKTLTAPTIADFTNMAHDHLDADDGGVLPAGVVGYFDLDADAGAPIGSGIADYFGSTSSFSYAASTTYEIIYDMTFLKTTAGTTTWTVLFGAAPTASTMWFTKTPIAGALTTGAAESQIIRGTTGTTLVLGPTGSLTTAVDHHIHIRLCFTSNTASDVRMRVTSSAGTVTPRRFSRYTVHLIPANTGSFVA